MFKVTSHESQEELVMSTGNQSNWLSVRITTGIFLDTCQRFARVMNM